MSLAEEYSQFKVKCCKCQSNAAKTIEKMISYQNSKSKKDLVLLQTHKYF